VGVLLSHGFTGSPQSIRPWGEYLAARGFTVAVPRLPGHGTRWQEMQRMRWDDWYGEVDTAFRALSARCEQVVVGGLSMGGALALRVAQVHGDAVSGVVLVNPIILMDDKRLAALPVLKYLVPSLKGIADDIKKQCVTEGAYDRTPLRALHALTKGLRLVQADLGKVTQPVLLFRSTEDHIVTPASGKALLGRITSRDTEERLLPESYHVATLDNDAEQIFAGSVEFVQRLTATSAPTPAEG
jgi:carboxylesterase